MDRIVSLVSLEDPALNVGRMTGDIRKHLEVTPFVPFLVRTSDGREYPVPTMDHIYLPPSGGRVVISDDAGELVVLPGLMITALVHTDGRGH